MWIAGQCGEFWKHQTPDMASHLAPVGVLPVARQHGGPACLLPCRNKKWIGMKQRSPMTIPELIIADSHDDIAGIHRLSSVTALAGWIAGTVDVDSWSASCAPARASSARFPKRRIVRLAARPTPRSPAACQRQAEPDFVRAAHQDQRHPS